MSAVQAIYAWDEALFRTLHVNLHPEWMSPLYRIVTDSGLGHVQLAALLVTAYRHKMGRMWSFALVGVLIIALCFIEKRWTIGVAMAGMTALFWHLPAPICFGSFWSGVIAGIVRYPLAEWVHRVRPSNLEFSKSLEKVYGASSFPSGHSTTSFAIAIFIIWMAQDLPDKRFAYVMAAWALLVGFSRVFVGVHYPTDVLGALALAVLISTLVWLWLEDKVKLKLSLLAGDAP